MDNIPNYRKGYKETVKKVIDQDTGRSKWEVDMELFDKKEQEDQLIDGQLSKTTRTLQHRTESLNLDEGVGKKKVVYNVGNKKDQAGYYCQLCDILVNDSNSWLDHLNSRQHNRMLGMNMNVERVGSDRIKEKLKFIEQEKQKGGERKDISIEELTRKIEEDMKKKKEQKEQKRQKKLDEQLENTLGKMKEKKKVEKVVENKEQIQENKEEEEEDDELDEILRLGLPTSFKSK